MDTSLGKEGSSAFKLSFGMKQPSTKEVLNCKLASEKCSWLSLLSKTHHTRLHVSHSERVTSQQLTSLRWLVKISSPLRNIQCPWAKSPPASSPGAYWRTLALHLGLSHLIADKCSPQGHHHGSPARWDHWSHSSIFHIVLKSYWG